MPAPAQGLLRSGSVYHYYPATALAVFWPEAEHARMLIRWPHLAAEIGTTWGEHRRRVERHCALIEDNGLRVEQAAGDVAGFEAFLASRNVTEPSRSDLQEYPDMRTQPTLFPWPPARTAACWCGSGRKYKQCCRPHGLGNLSDAATAVRIAGAGGGSARETAAERRPAANSQPQPG